MAYEKLPNISVNLSQVKADTSNIQVSFNATVFCKAETGPIGEVVKVTSYNEAVKTFGIGTSRTPALYGIEQVLKSYGTLNIVRLASNSAAQGTFEAILKDSSSEPYEGNIKVLSGKTDYKTDLFNGDEVKLEYDSTNTRLYIKATLNGTTYKTPLELIDLSTATAPDIEAKITKLVNIFNELGTGVTLKNEYINKTASDRAIAATDIVKGTFGTGDSGLTGITNEIVTELFKLIDDVKFTKQDVIICPEFRDAEVVNAGIALKNKYFYIVGIEGETLLDKQTKIDTYTQSDEGVAYIPSKCYFGDTTIEVPFECAALYVWANTYNDSRYKAPAGTRRGILPIVTDLIDNLTEEDAEVIYNGNIPANFVKYISGYGFTVFGQKTMDATQDFTNRINVSGLVSFITVEGEKLLYPYLFEYTPIGTYQQVSMDISKLLDTLVTQDIINNNYRVVCDNSNNTPETLANHELHVLVAIQPISVTEYIYLELTVTDQLGGEE